MKKEIDKCRFPLGLVAKRLAFVQRKRLEFVVSHRIIPFQKDRWMARRPHDAVLRQTFLFTFINYLIFYPE